MSLKQPKLWISKYVLFCDASCLPSHFPQQFGCASDPTTLDTRVAYDKNGRILGKRSGGVSSGDSAEYIYQSDSYKLERVEGRVSLSRDASYYGTFQYDVSGNMLEDRSKGVSLQYGPDGMPTLLRSSHRPPGAGELETLLYPFYDVSGQRVSEVAHPRLHPAFPVYFAGTAEGSEPESLYTVADVAEAWGDAHYRLNTQNLRALDSVVVYVVADDGYSYVLPDTTGYSELYQGDTVVPVAVRGVEKYSAQYDSLLALRAGRPLLARHWVRLGGVVTAERTDHYDTAGAVAETRGFAYVQGRGTPIGRYVSSGGGTYQFFVKNHLGSTVRVVNADGSYATTPVFDYQAYGEAQVVREDTLDPMGPRYTGKGLDTEVNLYYFGARWYDQELGVWVTPDPARQFLSPYSYGGNPVVYTDPDGNFLRWKINGDGVGIGFNLTPIGIPWGAGVNLGWGNGGYVGGYTEVGYAVGGDGMGLGATVETGANYGFNGSGWTEYASVTAFGSLGPIGGSASVSTSYNSTHGQWGGITAGGGVNAWGVGPNASYNFQSGDWSVGVGYGQQVGDWNGGGGVGYGSRGFTWSAGGGLRDESVHKRIEDSYNRSAAEADGQLKAGAMLASAHYEAGDMTDVYRRELGLPDSYSMTDNELDAFRHQYWSAKLTSTWGRILAQRITTAYESSTYLSNSPSQRRMDLANNSIGHASSRWRMRSSDIYPRISSNINGGNWVDIHGIHRATGASWNADY